MKFLLAAITALLGTLALTGASPALAQQGTVWTIQNGTFADGATFGGTFTYDADANQYTSWNITTTTGTQVTGFTYSSAIPGQYSSGSTISAYFSVTGGTEREFDLYFSSSLNLGGTKSLTGAEYGDDLSTIRQVTGGSITEAGAAPEPASWALMIGGFGVIGGALRVRRRRAEGLLPG